MESYKTVAFTPEIEEMLAEDERRLNKLFGTHDQLSGKGIHKHTNKVVIDDYPIRTQWLTDEVYNNGLYQAVIREGSVAGFVESFNSRLKGSEQVTEEDVINQLFFARCSRDPSFAFYTCFTVKSKETGEMMPFKLRYSQLLLLSIMEDLRLEGKPIRIILLKARQWGGSTLVQLYMAWIQLFVKEGWYSVIVAQTTDTAKRLKAMYKKVLENMPSFIFGVSGLRFSPYEHSSSDSIITDAQGSIVRDNVITVASYENFESTRGMDYAMAHYSECAYWRTTPGKSAEQVITNIDANIMEKPLTIEVSESSANGAEGYFYNEYQMAKKGTSSSRALFIPFFLIETDMLPFKDKKEKRLFLVELLKNREQMAAPNDNSEPGAYLYSLWEKGATLEHIKWYKQKRAAHHDHASMASEAPSDDIECFKYSGHLVFNIYVVDTMREKYVATPEFIGEIVQSEKTGRFSFPADPNGGLRIWKRPNDLRTANEYLVVVDVGGRSRDSDPSCITVIDRWPLRFAGGKPEVVARWHGHIRYDFLAYKAVKIARYYKDALLAFESNTFDKKKAEASEFVEQGDHIRGILKKVEDIYPNLYMRPATDPEDIRNGILRKIGFQTNKKTKQDMVDNFLVAFEDDQFIDPDERLYAEAAIYEQRPDGSYGNIPGRGKHDDILMTDMIGSLISDEMPLPVVVRKDEGGRIGDGFEGNESRL